MTAADIQRSRLSGHVYFIQSGDRPVVKIGWALNPADRIRQLQCGNPDELRIIATIEGTFADELAWRRYFSRLRIRGEWFSLTDELMAAINRGQHFIYVGDRDVGCLRSGAWATNLDEGKVRRIRRDKRTVRAIAAAYNVSKTCVQDIRMRRTWKHVA